jgi:hypothetical protein
MREAYDAGIQTWLFSGEPVTFACSYNRTIVHKSKSYLWRGGRRLEFVTWELKRRFRNEAMRGAVSLIALFTSVMSPLRIFASLCAKKSNQIKSLVTFYLKM